MSPMGAPAVCCHLCHFRTFSTALAADTADTNICSELGPAACSTMQHSQPLRSTAQVCPGPRRSADCPHRAEHCTHPHHCTVLYCTALYMCGEEMCFVFMVDKYLYQREREIQATLSSSHHDIYIYPGQIVDIECLKASV